MNKPANEKQELHELREWLSGFDNELNPSDFDLCEARKVVNREYEGGLEAFWLDGGY